MTDKANSSSKQQSTTSAPERHDMTRHDTTRHDALFVDVRDDVWLRERKQVIVALQSLRGVEVSEAISTVPAQSVKQPTR